MKLGNPLALTAALGFENTLEGLHLIPPHNNSVGDFSPRLVAVLIELNLHWNRLIR